MRWRDHLDALSLPPAEHRELEQALDEATPEHGIRAALSVIASMAIERHNPRRSADYAALIQELPRRGPFAYMSDREMLLRIATAAHLIWPDLPISRACEDLVAEGFDVLNQTPFFQPIYLACDNDLGRFIDTLPSTHSLLFNSGLCCVPEHEPRCAVLRYEGVSARARHLLVEGYNQRLARFFSPHGESRFEFISPICYEQTFRW